MFVDIDKFFVWYGKFVWGIIGLGVEYFMEYWSWNFGKFVVVWLNFGGKGFWSSYGRNLSK